MVSVIIVWLKLQGGIFLPSRIVLQTKNDDINQANVFKKCRFLAISNEKHDYPAKSKGGGGGQWNKKHNDNQCGQNSLSIA